MNDTAVSKDGSQEIELNKWHVDESTGEKTMYTRLQTIDICKAHSFNTRHECTRCPYVFTGFRANLHIQQSDGIYERSTGKKIA